MITTVKLIQMRLPCDVEITAPLKSCPVKLRWMSLIEIMHFQTLTHSGFKICANGIFNWPKEGGGAPIKNKANNNSHK